MTYALITVELDCGWNRRPFLPWFDRWEPNVFRYMDDKSPTAQRDRSPSYMFNICIQCSLVSFCHNRHHRFPPSTIIPRDMCDQTPLQFPHWLLWIIVITKAFDHSSSLPDRHHGRDKKGNLRKVSWKQSPFRWRRQGVIVINTVSCGYPHLDRSIINDMLRKWYFSPPLRMVLAYQCACFCLGSHSTLTRWNIATKGWSIIMTSSEVDLRLEIWFSSLAAFTKWVVGLLGANTGCLLPHFLRWNGKDIPLLRVGSYRRDNGRFSAS